MTRDPRTTRRPWQVYALTALWALKGAEELFRGVIGGGFYVSGRASLGALSGYPLQLAFQSLFFSGVMAAGSFYVMVALWLGRGAARPWGVTLAILSETMTLLYLITRPPEFGGDVRLVRTVIIATVVNLGIVAFLLFDGRLAVFLGSPRLVGWWTPRR